MDFLIDNQDTENKFQEILSRIKLARNGDVSDAMKRNGMVYKMNWGVSLVLLRQIAKEYETNHLLALKLWNKQWRETMILATLLDEPEKVTEEQMDFWTKSFENSEIAEIASTHLWVKTKFAFIKALEWCRGKKHLVHFTGIHLMGRLAMVQQTVIDEMFEPFFEELPILAKDKKLHTVLFRSVIALGSRSEYLNSLTAELALNLQQSESDAAIKLGETLYDELTSAYFQDLLKNKNN